MTRRLPACRPGVKMAALSGKTLYWIGFALTCLSSFSAAILQRGILKLGEEDALEAVSEAMKPGGGAMGWATGAVLCSLAAALAIPIFAKLACEGWKRADNGRNFLLRLAVCALVSEVPYDFAMSGKALDLRAQNPVWALLLAAVALEITRRQRMKSKTAEGLFRAVVVLAALAWALLLRVCLGFTLILLTVLFRFAEKWKGAVLLGGIVISLPQFPAPAGMLFVHWHDEKREPCSEKLPYLLYPAQLLVFGLLALPLQ